MFRPIRLQGMLEFGFQLDALVCVCTGDHINTYTYTLFRLVTDLPKRTFCAFRRVSVLNENSNRPFFFHHLTDHGFEIFKFASQLI